MMNKKLFIEALIQKLEKKIADLEKSIQETQKAVINAPSAMKSWSDTSRFQLRSIAANLESQHQRIEKCLQELKEIDTSKKYQKVELGTLAKIKIDNQISNYFFSPAGSGGEILNINKEQIRTLSIDSPLAKKLLNKKMGDTIRFKTAQDLQNMSILEIN